MTYQHVAEERNAVLAAQMDALSAGAFAAPRGTRVARGGVAAISGGAVET
jgi:hypothetical protein